MRAMVALATVAVLSAVGGSAQAVDEQEPEITRASLRTRLVPIMYFPENPGPPRIPLADVDIRGLLPEGFDLDPSEAPVPVEFVLNGVTVLGGADDPISIAVAPSGRAGRWDPAPSTDPDVQVEYARWLRVRLDLGRGTFHFRTRSVDPAVMEGEPTAVPYLIRIGEREFSGTLDFPVAGPRHWIYTRR